jgi:hypothetical protein
MESEVEVVSKRDGKNTYWKTVEEYMIKKPSQ